MNHIPKQIIYPLSYLGFTHGHKIKDGQALFIAELQKYLNAPYSPLPLGRARMGIYLLVKTSVNDVRKKVILSAYTIPDVVNMVILAGGEPVFVDTYSNSTNIDIDHLGTLLDSCVACVLVTHYHVSQNNISDIYNLCAKQDVRLFEDCAIALGASINNHHVGLCSDGGILSFSGYKNLNYVWGGAVFSRDEKINEALKAETAGWEPLKPTAYLKQGIRTLRYDIATRPFIFNWFTFPVLKLKQRISPTIVQLTVPRLETHEIDDSLMSLPNEAAFAEWLLKLPSVEKHLQHRRNIAAIYDSYFSTKMISGDADKQIKSGSAFINYPLAVNPDSRHLIYRDLKEMGFDVGLSLYPCCSNHERFRSIPGKTTNTELLEQSAITLPTHPRVTTEYAHALADCLGHVFNRY